MALYHTVRGPVDYTVVGSPTIVDGVVSGFSADDYLRTSSVFSNTDMVELFVRVKNPSQLAARGICGASTYNGNFGLVQYGNGTISAILAVKDADNVNKYRAITGNVSTLISNEYDIYAKYDISNRVIELKYWDVSGTVLFEGSSTFEATDTVIAPTAYYLGKNQYGAFGGEIDLNHTYIKVNAQAWFGNCPVEVKHINYGAPNDYVLTGNATVVDGVLSNVDNNSSAYTTKVIPEFNKFELIWKCGYTQSSIATGNYFPLFGFGNSTNSATKITWTMTSDKGLHFDKSNTSEGEYLSTVYNSVFDPVTEYNNNGYLFGKFVVEKSGGKYNYTIYASADGITWTAGNTYAEDINLLYEGGNKKVWFNKNGTGSAAGRIKMFLNETYIKIDDKLWFYKPATNYVIRNEKLVFADQGLYLTGPVNYTVVGTPTITDGVLSNTDGSNYISLDTGLAINSNFEFIIKCRRTAQESRFFSSNPSAYIASNSNDNGVVLEIPGNTYSSRISCANINEWFYIKVSGDGTDLTFSTKLPNESQFAHSTTLSVPSYQDLTILRLGRGYGSSAGGCEIDLKETYIKVNGDLWFYGKNYATKNIAPVPSGYTYGTTTTSAIGYVDMRTQVFTAAPTGATIGRDA